MLRLYLAPVVLIGLIAPSAARTWTDCTGINRTEAEIIAIGDNSVTGEVRGEGERYTPIGTALNRRITSKVSHGQDGHW